MMLSLNYNLMDKTEEIIAEKKTIFWKKTNLSNLIFTLIFTFFLSVFLFFLSFFLLLIEIFVQAILFKPGYCWCPLLAKERKYPFSNMKIILKINFILRKKKLFKNYKNVST